MSLVSKVRRSLLIAIPLICGSLSCGGMTTNNDQGTSFLAFGWSSDGTTVNLTGIIVPLATDQPAFSEPAGAGQVDGKTALVYLGVQNRLANQFIRIVRIDCRYDVQGGAGLSIPNDSYNSSEVLGPATVTDANGGTTGGGTIQSANTPSEAFLQFELVSPDVYSFLNVYRNQLPQLPFRMTATCHAVGFTQAGDQINSNDLFFLIQFVDQAECCTGAQGEVVGVNGGFQIGTGNGGGITFDDGTTATTITTGVTNGGGATGAATVTGSTTTGSTVTGTTTTGTN